MRAKGQFTETPWLRKSGFGGFSQARRFTGSRLGELQGHSLARGLGRDRGAKNCQRVA